MYTFFLVCAGVGGTLILLQFLAGAFGFGGDHGDAAGHHDFATDHSADGHEHGSDANWFLGLLTFRAITAASELPTGTPVRVVAVLGPCSVEVTHATSEA